MCLFRATTHTDIQLRAREKGIPVRVIHNASVMNAVGAAGLQLYRFGEVGLMSTSTSREDVDNISWIGLDCTFT